MTPEADLYISIRHEINKMQNYRREMEIKGGGFIAEQLSDWELAERAARRILKLIPKK
jgi:hypothetical protein